MKDDENGFSLPEIALIVVIVLIVTFTGWFVWHSKKSADKSLSTAANTTLAIGTKAASKTSTPATQQTTSQKSASSSGSATSTKSTSSGTKTSPVSSPPSTPSQTTNTDPTITITAPSDGAVITGGTFTLSCSHNTPNGYHSNEGSIQNVGGTPYFEGLSEGQPPTNQCLFYENTNKYPNGNYVVTLTVTDNLGKTATATSHFSIQH